MQELSRDNLAAAAAHSLLSAAHSPILPQCPSCFSSSKMNGGSVAAPIPKLAHTMKAEVPDASEWTIMDVVDFFTEMGFSQQSEVFQEQVS